MGIRHGANITKIWYTEFENLERPEKKCLSWSFFTYQSIESLIQLFLLSLVPSFAIFIQFLGRL